MKNHYDLLIQGANVAIPTDDLSVGKSAKMTVCDVAILNGKIAKIGNVPASDAKSVLRAQNLTVLPGAIDTQVHFRDPGFPEKETLQSGTMAAMFGGVTSVFEMPNTKPPTLTAIDISDKLTRAKKGAWCNYAFYVGASAENYQKLSDLEKLPGVCGVKMFMGSSTGNLVVEGDVLTEKVVENGSRRMSIHCEDNDRLNARKHIVNENRGNVGLHPEWRDEESAMIATQKIVRLAEKWHRPVHVLHVTSAREIEFLRSHKSFATVEVTPQHLTLFAPDCYQKLGTFAQMNPPIRTREHYEALWIGVHDGTVDVLGSDHAPHTTAEKLGTYPDTPSGMTGVQTLMPIMLNHVNEKKLSLERLVELTSHNPARIFKIENKGKIAEGYDADLILVDLNKKMTIENSWIKSICGWTPFDGTEVQGWVVGTLLGGQMAMRDGEIIGGPKGQPISFTM